ncbi:transposase family protein [Desulfococcaceae bacterium HSG8]|nr:transposase family protein [Desulfococcaceae bacterium HSG8]
MEILYDADSDSRRREHPSHFPWDNPYCPFGNGTDSGKKGRHEAAYPGIPFPFPRPEISAQSSDRFIEELLNIPDIAVERTETDGEGNLIIRVRSTVTGTRCNKCGRDTDKPYGYGREIMLRHLSVFGRKTYILISQPRYQCTCCEGNPVTTQKASWYEQRSPHTATYGTGAIKMVDKSFLIFQFKRPPSKNFYRQWAEDKQYPGTHEAHTV